MALPPLLKRRPPDIADTRPLQVSDPLARARARRRLIGAAVLVAIAVVALPLLFESQPRPRADAPAKTAAGSDPGSASSKPSLQQGRTMSGSIVESAPEAASMPAATPAATASAPSAPVVPQAPAIAAPAEQKKSIEPSKAASNEARPAEKPVERSPEKATAKAAEKSPAKPPERPVEKAGGKPEPGAVAVPAVSKSGRFVVQVGAFADDASAKEARTRVERLGLKTFTQDVEVQGARRIRVRVGPFESQADADRAVATLKAGKLPGVVMKL